MLKRIFAVLIALTLTAAPAFAAINTLPDGSYIETINYKRFGWYFKPGLDLRIRGKGLAQAVSGWIIGDLRGGSVLEIISSSDTEIHARVSTIRGAKTNWPKDDKRSESRKQITLKLVVAGGARVFEFRLREASYLCFQRDPNCD